jgi:hypothetical protein
MIENRHFPSVMKQGVAHLPGCRSDITGAVHPVRIFFGRRWGSDMKVDVTGMGMIDDPTVEKAGALMGSYNCLGMNTCVNARKIMNPVAQELFHLFQKAFQGDRFLAALNRLDPTIFNG